MCTDKSSTVETDRKKCYITFVSSVTRVFFSLTSSSSAYLANALGRGTERMLQSSC